jgi:hypothetical protein
LAYSGCDGKIGDEGVFGFAGTVGNDGCVFIAPCQIDGSQGFALAAALPAFGQCPVSVTAISLVAAQLINSSITYSDTGMVRELLP